MVHSVSACKVKVGEITFVLIIKQGSGDYFISNEEKYYLRHVGDDPRPKDPANFEKDFPGTRLRKIRFVLTCFKCGTTLKARQV